MFGFQVFGIQMVIILQDDGKWQFTFCCFKVHQVLNLPTWFSGWYVSK